MAITMADPGVHDGDPRDHEADPGDHDRPILVFTVDRSWRSRSAEIRTAYGQGIAIGPDGDPVVTGELSRGFDGSDLWVGKLAAEDGALIWEDTHDSGPGKTADVGRAVAVSELGLVSVAGYVQPSGIVGTYRKYTAEGEFLCDAQLDPNPGFNTLLYGATVDLGGYPIVTGATKGFLYIVKFTP